MTKPIVPSSKNRVPWIEICQECKRLGARFFWRIQILFLRFKLRGAEQKLGELGWQQADFDMNRGAAGTLTQVEKEQSRLMFEIGDTKEKITLQKNRTQENLDALQRKIRTAAEVAEATEAEAAKTLKSITLENDRQSPAFIVEPLLLTLEDVEKSLRDHRHTLQVLQSELIAAEADAVKNLDALKAELRSLEGQQTKLAQTKPSHFRSIGHELADAQIAPLNQPESLMEVLAIRNRQALFQASINKSMQMTRQSRKRVTWGAKAILCIAVITIFIFLNSFGILRG